MNASSGSTATENVRHYFSKLALKGQSRTRLQQWATLPVETFFVALRLPGSALNVERRPAAAESQSLAGLFANIRWE